MIIDDTRKANTEEPSEYRHDLTPSEYHESYVRKWVENDRAKLIGGCCGVFPEHINCIASTIKLI